MMHEHVECVELHLKTLALLVSIIAAPTTVFGQAAITGNVSDPSGAPLAGVTVDARSGALLEPRTAATDADGRYRIENLRPCIYTVTFTLDGGSRHQERDVELAGSFTATGDASLTLGALTDTVTVESDTPVVD